MTDIWLMARSAGLGALLALSLTASPAAAQKAGSVFTVSNYPVEASAASAVAAKDKALADGQAAAFRSLLKRIVPVTAYKQLTRVASVNAGDMISGVSVRSERYSATDYIATLDFSFQADAVRAALAGAAVPFVDQQAESVTVIPVVLKAGAIAEGEHRGGWRQAWSSLDLTHTLTPVRLDGMKVEIHADTLKMMLNGDDNGYRIVSKEYQTDRVVLAVAEPDLSEKKMLVTLAGVDAVGPFVLKRSYRLSDGDVAYAMELASVVALGVLEGRWKSVRSQPAIAATSPDDVARPAWAADGGANSAGEPMTLYVEFSNAAQWNDIRAQLLDTPGVEGLEIGTISERTASVTLRYPGGAQGLANAVGARGLTVINSSQGWVLRASN